RGVRDRVVEPGAGPCEPRSGSEELREDIHSFVHAVARLRVAYAEGFGHKGPPLERIPLSADPVAGWEAEFFPKSAVRVGEDSPVDTAREALAARFFEL